MTTWHITRSGSTIYSSTSYPRFLVQWRDVQHLPDADWTTTYSHKEH